MGNEWDDSEYIVLSQPNNLFEITFLNSFSSNFSGFKSKIKQLKLYSSREKISFLTS